MSGGGVSRPGLVAMLLDNAYAPDNRVQFEAGLLTEAGHRVRVVAWDRRDAGDPPVAVERSAGTHGEEIIRIQVPAPPGGGAATLLRLLRLSRETLTRRRLFFREAGVLVVHDIYLLPLGWLLSRLMSLPLVYDAHEEFAAAEGLRYPPYILRAASALETTLARRAAAVIVPGRSRVKRWTAVGITPVVLPNIGRTVLRPDAVIPSRDIVYCGTLDLARRPDLLVDLARRRPDISVAVAGRGRWAEAAAAAANELENFEYCGWTDDPDGFLATGRCVYYGLDPTHPYASKACPNTLYQAVRLRRPLIFFCGGEPEATLGLFRIGLQCRASVASLTEAVDDVRMGRGHWEFASAWNHLSSPSGLARYVHAIAETTSTPRPAASTHP